MPLPVRRLMIVFLALSAFSAPAGEVAPPAVPPPAPAAAPEAAPNPEKDKPRAEADKAPPVPPAGMPQFPLKSEFFSMVLDNQVEDQQEAQQIESNVMNEILKAISESSEEHLVASINQKAKFRELMLRAEQYRGHVVQIRGLLENSEAKKIGDNPAGIQRIYMGQISNMMGEIVTFVSLTPPEGTGKVPVRLTGVFLKRFAYLNRQEGEKLTWTPLVFVKRVESYSEEDEQRAKAETSWISYVLSGAAFFVFIGWFLFRLNRFANTRRAKDNPFTRKKKEIAARKENS